MVPLFPNSPLLPKCLCFPKHPHFPEMSALFQTCTQFLKHELVLTTIQLLGTKHCVPPAVWRGVARRRRFLAPQVGERLGGVVTRLQKRSSPADWRQCAPERPVGTGGDRDTCCASPPPGSFHRVPLAAVSLSE